MVELWMRDSPAAAARCVQHAAYKEVGPAADSRNLRIEGEFVL